MKILDCFEKHSYCDILYFYISLYAITSCALFLFLNFKLQTKFGGKKKKQYFLSTIIILLALISSLPPAQTFFLKLQLIFNISQSVDKLFMLTLLVQISGLWVLTIKYFIKLFKTPISKKTQISRISPVFVSCIIIIIYSVIFNFDLFMFCFLL